MTGWEMGAVDHESRLLHKGCGSQLEKEAFPGSLRHSFQKKGKAMSTRDYSARSPVRPILSVTALCFGFLVGCAGIQPDSPAGAGRFEIAFIGDQQYNRASEAQYPHIMAELNRSDLAFIVHVGDFKGASSRCDDALFRQRRAGFDASTHPLVYTPGDNDWTDCHAPRAGGYDTEERLSKLRDVFFDDNQSLGQRKLTLERQSDTPQYSKFRENARWTFGNVLFVTLHMVGSNNNLGRVPKADAEYRDRNAANLAWLRESFAVAKRGGAKAVAIFMQANPRFEFRLPSGRVNLLGIRPSPKKPSGFTDFIFALEDEVLAFKKPVVLLHGDSHYFRIDKPLFRTGEDGPANFGHQIENFTRVETFGFPETHWVRVIVDPSDPHVFTFKEQIVDKNRYVGALD
jgi:hypothetical protein